MPEAGYPEGGGGERELQVRGHQRQRDAEAGQEAPQDCSRVHSTGMGELHGRIVFEEAKEEILSEDKNQPVRPANIHRPLGLLVQRDSLPPRAQRLPVSPCTQTPGLPVQRDSRPPYAQRLPASPCTETPSLPVHRDSRPPYAETPSLPVQQHLCVPRHR
eukprot:365291-Chlamydomonas_euryale.AAC.3